MLKPNRSNPLSLPEFIALMALMSALMALSIDAMLPALATIGQELGVSHPNDNQLIVHALFLGLAAGLLFFGPLSDSFGRKPPLYVGLLLYIVGCLISINATTFNQMLVGRLIQGMGLAAPRVVSLAIIRDQFKGEEMAKVMSFVMMVFILVPAIAPAIGLSILAFAPWQAIFGLFLGIATLLLLWFGLRQPETLTPTNRTPFTLSQIIKAIIEVCKLRESMGPTIALGVIFGAFLGYLSTSQQLFQGLYHKGNQFALYFGILALAFGGASMLNAKWVQQYGMQRLSKGALVLMALCSFLFLAVCQMNNGVPPFWSFFLFLTVCFSCIAILFGNLNAMAMEPVGHIAGLGAAVIGTISTLISATLGIYIGQLYDQTLLPLTASFAVLASLSFFVLAWSQKKALIPASP